MERVIAYIDGFNLYYGLRSKGWKRFYWLNLQTLSQQILKPHQRLVYTKYFTSIVNRPVSKHRRQSLYLEALQTLPDFRTYYGHFLENTVTCRSCRHSYQTHHEKMTDVNIAVELMVDAFEDSFDTALLISADSDLIPPIQAVQRLFSSKRIVVVFPPRRISNSLKQITNGYIFINRNILAQSVLPDRVIKPDGVVLQRPSMWR